MKRATFFISGRVQGVGFRYRSTEIAQSFVVSGALTAWFSIRFSYNLHFDPGETNLFGPEQPKHESKPIHLLKHG